MVKAVEVIGNGGMESCSSTMDGRRGVRGGEGESDVCAGGEALPFRDWGNGPGVVL